ALRGRRGGAGPGGGGAGRGLVCGGVVGGVGVVCDPCHIFRGAKSPLLGGVLGPAKLLSLDVGPPIAAGLSCGISLSGGGGMGVCVHGASASATAAGVWKRWLGPLAIIRSTMADTPSGVCGRSCRIGFGWRV